MQKISFGFVFTAAIHLMPVNCIGQEPPDVVRIFLECILDDGQGCVKDLYQSGKWLSKDTVAIERVDSELRKLSSSVNLIGQLEGYELIRSRRMGETFWGLVYVLKYERQPIRLTFVYYNSKSSWSLFNFEIDEDIDVTFKKTLRALDE
jgi:hypothetical protein